MDGYAVPAILPRPEGRIAAQVQEGQVSKSRIRGECNIN